MGTRCTVVLPDMDEMEADDLFRLIKNEIARIEGMLSRFREDSNLSAINKNAAAKPFVVNREMFRIMKAASYYFEKTGGLFDITLRPVLQYWKDNPNGDKKHVAEMLKNLARIRSDWMKEARRSLLSMTVLNWIWVGSGKDMHLKRSMTCCFGMALIMDL